MKVLPDQTRSPVYPEYRSDIQATSVTGLGTLSRYISMSCGQLIVDCASIVEEEGHDVCSWKDSITATSIVVHNVVSLYQRRDQQYFCPQGFRIGRYVKLLGS